MKSVYSSSEVAVRIKEELKSKKITAKKMLIDLELGPATLGHYETSMPKADNLAIIADYLGVSVDYLLGRTDNPCVGYKKACNNNNNNIAFGNSCYNNSVAIGETVSKSDELEQEICSILKRLPLRKRTELLTIVYNYVDENDEKEVE